MQRLPHAFVGHSAHEFGGPRQRPTKSRSPSQQVDQQRTCHLPAATFPRPHTGDQLNRNRTNISLVPVESHRHGSSSLYELAPTPFYASPPEFVGNFGTTVLHSA